MTGAYARAVALAGMCGLLFTGVLAFQSPQALAAPATQTKPPTADSFYVTSTSTSTAYSHGCNQGNADANNHASSMVILDFGAQLADGSGVDNWDAGHISNEQVEDEAEAFAHGYWVCTGSDTSSKLDLAIGTNNSGAVSSALGTTWAHVVAAVQSHDQAQGYASQVVAMGGDDMEPGFGGPTAAKDWARGYYNAGTGTVYADFGSADGCPPAGSTCNNGWTQYDEWFVSWGATAAVPTPEIYTNTAAWQWEDISLYGVNNEGGAILFWGPVSTPAYITPGDAWDDFANALCSRTSTCVHMSYSLRINWTW